MQILMYTQFMKSIMITGGAGFIGMNASQRFASIGWKVILVDDLSRLGSTENLSQVKDKYSQVDFIKLDIRDFEGIKNVVSKTKPNVLLHLAAQVAVTQSLLNPRHDFEVNAVGTLNVLEALRIFSPETYLIYASTNKVYGNLEDLELFEGLKRYTLKHDQHGINEKRSLDFHSPYGCSKGAADQYVLEYARNYDLQTTVLRQSCIYGPNQYGVEDQGWVAWFIIATILNQNITVFGNGKQVRDILHVSDLISLYENLISKPSLDTNVFNVGGGPKNSLSLLELIDFLKADLGITPKFDFSSERLGDQKYFVSDNSLLSTIGWSPQIELSTGIKDLHGWIDKNIQKIREARQ
jgi:CDP-paratose 2-epimerase